MQRLRIEIDVLASEVLISTPRIEVFAASTAAQ